MADSNVSAAQRNTSVEAGHNLAPNRLELNSNDTLVSNNTNGCLVASILKQQQIGDLADTDKKAAPCNVNGDVFKYRRDDLLLKLAKFNQMRSQIKPLGAPAATTQAQVCEFNHEQQLESPRNEDEQQQMNSRGESNENLSGTQSSSLTDNVDDTVIVARVAVDHRNNVSNTAVTTSSNTFASNVNTKGAGATANGDLANTTAPAMRSNRNSEVSEKVGSSSSIDGESASNQFCMRAYKVVKCNRRVPHSKSECKDWHDESDRRRNPFKFDYLPIRCIDIYCAVGDACGKAHNKFEICFHPSRFKTTMCNCGVSCNRRDKSCSFAHTQEERRILKGGICRDHGAEDKAAVNRIRSRNNGDRDREERRVHQGTDDNHSESRSSSIRGSTVGSVTSSFPSENRSEIADSVQSQQQRCFNRNDHSDLNTRNKKDRSRSYDCDNVLRSKLSRSSDVDSRVHCNRDNGRDNGRDNSRDIGLNHRKGVDYMRNFQRNGSRDISSNSDRGRSRSSGADQKRLSSSSDRFISRGDGAINNQEQHNRDRSISHSSERRIDSSNGNDSSFHPDRNQTQHRTATTPTGNSSRSDSEESTRESQQVEFMAAFKVNKCFNCSEHGAFTCFDWHSTDERRRNPFLYSYSPKKCPHLGQCSAGDACPLAHSKLEYLYHPTRFKTMMCVDGYTLCALGKYCSFAHSSEERRASNNDAVGNDSKISSNARETGAAGSAVDLSAISSPVRNESKSNNNSNNIILSISSSASLRLITESSEGIAPKVVAAEVSPSAVRCIQPVAVNFASSSANMETIHDSFMATFKVIKCVDHRQHDTQNCWNWHSLADRRRNPFETLYECFECPAAAACSADDACSKAHNSLESFYHPDRFRIALCQFGPDLCERGDLCPFAHSEEDIRMPISHTVESQHCDNHRGERIETSSSAVQAKAIGGLKSTSVPATCTADVPVVTAVTAPPASTRGVSQSAKNDEKTLPSENEDAIHGFSINTTELQNVGSLTSTSSLVGVSSPLLLEQQRLVQLIRRCGDDGIVGSKLPTMYFEEYNKKLNLVDEFGEQHLIVDVLTSVPQISVNFVNSQRIYAFKNDVDASVSSNNYNATSTDGDEFNIVDNAEAVAAESKTATTVVVESFDVAAESASDFPANNDSADYSDNQSEDDRSYQHQLHFPSAVQQTHKYNNLSTGDALVDRLNHARMTSFKVFKCFKKNKHPENLCAHWHGERDRRRDPFVFNYSTGKCPKAGACTLGDFCSFAHNKFEFLFHPNFFRTTMCRTPEDCPRSECCAYVHSHQQLRIAEGKLKRSSGNAQRLVEEKESVASFSSEVKPLQQRPKLFRGSHRLGELQHRMVLIVKSFGPSGIFAGALPGIYAKTFGETADLTDEKGRKYKLSEVLQAAPKISTSFLLNQHKFVYCGAATEEIDYAAGGTDAEKSRADYLRDEVGAMTYYDEEVQDPVYSSSMYEDDDDDDRDVDSTVDFEDIEQYCSSDPVQSGKRSFDGRRITVQTLDSSRIEMQGATCASNCTSGSSRRGSRSFRNESTPGDVQQQREEFLSTYKISKCADSSSHRNSQCFNWHSAEDRRRNPFEVAYRSAKCRRAEGQCRAGDACKEAHNKIEVFFHPDRYKLTMCLNSDQCRQKKLYCAFSHSEEVRSQHAAVAAAIATQRRTLSSGTGPAAKRQRSAPSLKTAPAVSPKSISSLAEFSTSLQTKR